MGHLIHTPGLDRTLARLQGEFGAIQIDHEGTAQIRRGGERALRLATCFYANLPDSEIRYWIIDEYGEIVMEAGAAPE